MMALQLVAAAKILRRGPFAPQASCLHWQHPFVRLSSLTKPFDVRRKSLTYKVLPAMQSENSARLRRIVVDRLEDLHHAGVLQLPKARRAAGRPSAQRRPAHRMPRRRTKPRPTNRGHQLVMPVPLRQRHPCRNNLAGSRPGRQLSLSHSKPLPKPNRCAHAGSASTGGRWLHALR